MSTENNPDMRAVRRSIIEDAGKQAAAVFDAARRKTSAPPLREYWLPAREQYIQERADVSDLAVKVGGIAKRILEDLSRKISIDSLGRQLRDSLSDAELGYLVICALFTDSTDESVQDIVADTQIDRAKALGSKDCRSGLDYSDWPRISRHVFSGRVLHEEDYCHVASYYRIGYSDAVEWRRCDSALSLISKPPYDWEIEPADGGGFLYRPRRDGWAISWAVAEKMGLR